MANRNTDKERSHGPANAEYEIRKAYNCAIETGVTLLWNRHQIPQVRAEEAIAVYKHSFNWYRRGNRLAAERWARTGKHLSRAFWHEAKIAYLEPRTSDLPFLEGAGGEEYDLHVKSDSTVDLLNSVATHVPPGLTEMPLDMKRYLARAHHHLETLNLPEYKHELLRAERIKAAHEYGRVLECMALAYEAEANKKQVA